MEDVLQYFSLERDPFSDTDTDGLFFSDPGRSQILEELLHSSRYVDSILIVQGATGLGKTALKNALIMRIEEDVDLAVLSASAFMDVDSFLAALMEALGLEDEGQYNEDALGYFVEEANADDHLVLLVIDDAHELDGPVIHYIKALLHRFGGSLKVLLLADRIDDRWYELYGDNVQDVKSWMLQPFDRRQLESYIRYRMKTAGWQGKLPLDDSQLDAVYADSKGVPARINDAMQLLLSHMALRSEPVHRKPYAPIISIAVALGFLILVVLYWPSWDKRGTPHDEPEQGDISRAPEAISRHDEREAADERLSALLKQQGGSAESPDQVADEAVLPDDQTTVAVRLNEQGEESSVAVRTMTAVAPAAEVATPSESDAAPALPVPGANKVQDEADTDSDSETGESSVAEPVTEPEPEAVAVPAPPQPEPEIASISDNSPSPYSSDEQALLAAPASMYVIQLLGMRDEDKLSSFAAEARAWGRVREYRRNLSGKPYYVAVMTGFRTKEDAAAKLQQLPDKLSRNKPWLKSLGAVQQEINSR